MTSLAEEREAQGLWRLRPGREGIQKHFDALIENEFLPPETQHAHQVQRLSSFLGFCERHIPHYRDVFAGLGLKAGDVRDPADIQGIPFVTKEHLRDRECRARLCPKQGGPKRGQLWSCGSSGSTGVPTRVARTRGSMGVENMLLQRQLRWFRFDPQGSMAWIRDPKHVWVLASNRRLAPGETIVSPAWPGVGRDFVTGPCFAYGIDNSVEAKMAWLEERRPNYLRTLSSELDRLALGFSQRPAPAWLRGMRATGEPLTAGMQRRIETLLGAPVYISYGLMRSAGWPHVVRRANATMSTWNLAMWKSLTTRGAHPRPARSDVY